MFETLKLDLKINSVNSFWFQFSLTVAIGPLKPTFYFTPRLLYGRTLPLLFCRPIPYL